MDNFVSLVAIVVFAGIAIERAMRAGSWKAKAGISELRAVAYARIAEQVKRDFERYRAAATNAARIAEIAIDGDDPRGAIDALAELPTESSDRLSTSTERMLADAAAAAIAAEKLARLQNRGGLLGRLFRSGDGPVGAQGDAMDGARGDGVQAGGD